MTVVAMWCRHAGDNVIGIGNQIPWKAASDAKHFSDVVAGQAVVCGRKTYESLPERTIDGCEMWILTSQADYEVSNPQYHRVIHSQKPLADLEKDLYIAGGAVVYYLFMTGKEKLKPQIVVDCVYGGEVTETDGERVEITDSVEILRKHYRKISPDYCADGVTSAIWVRRGEFVEQSVLKRIVEILEADTEICS